MTSLPFLLAIAGHVGQRNLFARRASMTWAQRLKRVFDIEICPKCGEGVKIIACIEDPVVIDKILAHLDKKAALHEPVLLPAPTSTAAVETTEIRAKGDAAACPGATGMHLTGCNR